MSAAVAAIDFGTTYTGAAFSLHRDYKKNRLDIQVTTNSDACNTQSIKEPTAILFDPEEKFHAFGQQAVDVFRDLCQRNEDEARKWFYFSRFKITAFDQEAMAIRSELHECWGNHTMPSIRVFSAAIKHLKDEVVSRLWRYSLDESDVDWVITTPAVWNTEAKEFLKEAATEAGIPETRLVTVLEPEAATVFCRVESEERSLRGERLNFDLAHGLAGRKFLVLDCGGETSDAMVYEASKEEKSTLKELHPPSWTDWGGTRVDDSFHRFLHDFLGPGHMTSITMAQMLDLHREFEQAKRNFKPGDRVCIRLTSAITDLFLQGDFAKFPEVILQDDRLSIDSETFSSFFRPTVAAILDHVIGLLRHEKVRGVTTIVMVGGLSQCQLLRDAVCKAFPDVTVVLPDRAEASVLLGAVLYRHEPSVLGWRVSVFTYGVQVFAPFVEGVHAPGKQWINEDGKVRSSKVFRKFITSGDVLFVGKKSEVDHTCSPSWKDQDRLSVPILYTRNPNVTHVTEPGCEELGRITINYKTCLSDQRKRNLEVWMEVGSTKLKVKVRDTITGEVYETECVPPR